MLIHVGMQKAGWPVGLLWPALCAGAAGIGAACVRWLMGAMEGGRDDEIYRWLLTPGAVLGGLVALLIAAWPVTVFLVGQAQARVRLGVPVLVGAGIGLAGAAVMALLRGERVNKGKVDRGTIIFGLGTGIVASLLLALATSAGRGGGRWEAGVLRGTLGMAAGAGVIGAVVVIYRLTHRQRGRVGAMVVNMLTTLAAVAGLWGQVR